LILILAVTASCKWEKVEPAPQLPFETLVPTQVEVSASTRHWQGEMSGEVTQDSAILQARLTVDGRVRSGDVKGLAGIGAFVLSTSPDLSQAFWTEWMAASPDNDTIIKSKVSGLVPGTRYYYRLVSGADVDSLGAGPTGTFRTLGPRGVARETRFVAVTGMNRFAFLAKALVDLAFEDRSLGFPGLATITSHEPDFFVSTGDSVYYDSPYFGRAKDLAGMRAKWHRQFATPRFAALFLRVPTYWQKDDHDYRYDDGDPYGASEPSPELASKVFLEQVPVADRGDEDPRTYRTHRVNDLLQIWLLEGRDHRDPNTADPGPEKTLWGDEQRAWLEKTLLESTATFKILVSPTPLVGPDDNEKGGQGGFLAPYFGGRALGQGDDENKRDNHTNPFGFKHEGDAFFDWLEHNGFLEKNLYIVCGDKHWQYHSIHPQGFEEFSVGALVDANARLGPRPGDGASTDPDGLVNQPYAQEEASGGFLEVTVRPPQLEQPATIEFAFYDEHGALLYSTGRAAFQREPVGKGHARGAPVLFRHQE
jgi:alkaline phosphatase/alkaline phosphatase D